MATQAWEGVGFVKAVPSGDTLIIMGGAKTKRGPPPELTLTLTGIDCPRMGRADVRENEPFAWAAREFLRSNCIGKSVKFTVERRMDSGRSFGKVYLEGQNLSHTVVSEGFAKVKDKRDTDADQQNLLELQAIAKKDGKGLWAPAVAGVDTKCNVTAKVDAKKLFEEIEGKEVEAIIEYVRDGSSMRVVLLDQMVSVVFALAGVSCPRLGGRKNDIEPKGPEPFALEAKHFAEVRLLHRRVPLLIKMLNKGGDVFLGSVVHRMGDISEEILKRGLGRVVDWSLAYTPDPLKYRAAERLAKQHKLRQWHSYNPMPQSVEEFSGIVVEIVSGDTIVVQNETTGKDHRVSLSSTRTRRMGARGKEPEPFAMEAKEHIRHMLIGRRVKVEVEYSRTPQPRTIQAAPNADGTVPAPVVVPITGRAALPRVFATVHTLDNRRKNPAVSLVMQGLGEPVRHRQDDPRSRCYDQLLDAEVKAQRAKKGIHTDKQPPKHSFRDLTMTKGASRREFPALMRQKKHKAMIEYCFSGGRFKVFLPSQNCFLFFAISGLRCPNRARKARTPKDQPREAEPMSEEAHTYSRLNLMQRQVTIEIEDMDKGGTALGALFAPLDESKEPTNVGVALLSKGYAKIMGYSAERSPYRQQLESAAAAAQTAKRGLWQFEQPPAQEAVGSEETDEARVAVTVTEVVDGSTFYVLCDSDKAGLQVVEDQMAAFGAQMGTDPVPAPAPVAEGEESTAWAPRKNCLCAALYGKPAVWYRAQVTAFTGKGAERRAIVNYIDYGNSETVELNRLRSLSKELAATPRLAQACSLSFLRVPALDGPAADYGRDAAETLAALVWDKPLVMQQTSINRREKTRSVMLYVDGEVDNSVNMTMVSSGLARVDIYAKTKSTKLQEIIKKITALGEEAHTKHLGMFEYGDPADEYDE